MSLQNKILSEGQIVVMLEENNSLAWGHLYDKYAPSMYGLIYNLTKDKLLAEEIFMNAFLEFKQTRSKIKYALLPIILRHTYFFTTNYLNKIRITPKSLNKTKETEVIRLLTTQCNSLTEAASILNITAEETKKRLHVEFLKLRT